MKFKSVLLLAFVGMFAFSCSDDLAEVGSSIQPQSDEIMVRTDTFYVGTQNTFVDYIYTRQDSFLLGSFYNEKFGTTQADILAQVNFPLDFKFPAGSIGDSALVRLYYYSWFGDGLSPIDINIYEMNKNTFSYSTIYNSNINWFDYTDKSTKLGQRIITAQNADSISKSKSVVRFKLSDDFKNNFFKNADYSSESAFLNIFKGMYITTNYGASTLLNVSRIDLEYYYHYTYNVKKSNGADSTVVVRNVVVFPANSEVRQVNRFSHPDLKQKITESANVNYVASPASLNTLVNIPLKRINERINSQLSSKKLSLNSAVLGVEATNVSDSTLAMPLVSYMLLIKEDSVTSFFKKNKLPSDTYAILGKLSAKINSTSTDYDYYYNFDCATLIANQIKSFSMPADGLLKMRLVPVEVKLSSTNVVTSVKHAYKMSAVTIKSGKNTESPMKINMVYSGL